MSGFKRATVTISEEDYRRLHEADMRLRFAQKQQPASHDRAESDRHFAQLISELEERQQRFVEQMEALGEGVADLEQNAAEAVLSMQAEFYAEYWNQVDGMQADVQGMLDALDSQFRERILAEHESHLLEMRGLEERIGSVTGNMRRRAAIAERWIEAAATLAQFIDDRYPHEWFFPNRLGGITRDLQAACEAHREGMPEAAFLGAQQCYFGLSDLRLELEQATSEWNLLYQRAFQEAGRLQEVIATNTICPALDAAGHELPIPIDLHQWGGDQFHKLSQRTAGLLARLQRQDEPLLADELRDIVVRQCPALQKEFESILYQARLAVINSQLRINIAEVAARALEDQGFVVDEAQYMQGDQRAPFVVSMRGVEDNSVTIRVVPVSDKDTANALEIVSHDAPDRTEHELRQRAQEVYGTLLLYGLQVSAATVANGSERAVAPAALQPVRSSTATLRAHEVTR